MLENQLKKDMKNEMNTGVLCIHMYTCSDIE